MGFYRFVEQKIVKDLCHKKTLVIISFFFVCMYKMSSETKRLTKERKITAETYSKNRNHTIRA